MRNKNLVFTFIFLMTLASCGGKNGSSSKSNSPDNQEDFQEEQVTEGSYKAVLRTYNNTLSGWLPNGMVDIKIQGDVIEIKSWLDDSANVVHMQNIHMGTKCPGIESDLNKDGIIDYNETMKVAKQVLVPLDGDLNSQEAGLEQFPKGNYSYFQSASLSNLMQDLKAPDTRPNDFLTKLPARQSINLAGKVIIVTGVVESRVLPPTVSSINGLTPQASVPIACGVLELSAAN